MLQGFREQLDAVFREDGKLYWKLLAAVAVGVGVGLKLWYRYMNVPNVEAPIGCVCFTGATTAVSVFAVLALSLKDVVQRRIDEGRPVNLLLRCYLASGVLSLGLWIVTVILGMFLVAACGGFG